MRVSILKCVLFSIVICSFEYAQNHMQITNLIYMDFYQSTLNLASQLGDCVEGNKEIAHLRNIIDSHIKKHKGSSTSLDLKNVDSKTKKIINELRKELEEVKKELDNKRNDELAIQPIENKKIIKKDGNSSVSEHEDFKQLENNKNNKIESSNCYMKSKLTKKIKKKKTNSSCRI
ncbi:fam-b protein [Plasmodium berghei ANKA]|uniref:Fam-b protein n=1 Tax=Plasmodium berghei (strain Anka) TaxID=5823 RepID=A0A509AVZ6_PLABA|nr:fam-b protein [Plasmodium berghei ANKA]VUC58736.1 fam-b protein [Plasmodium berghei ANKA]|eukprot:XP_034424495.1 fam-b protein [Plasmodium berghei ANKA]